MSLSNRDKYENYWWLETKMKWTYLEQIYVFSGLKIC